MAAVLDIEQPAPPPSSTMSGMNFEELFNMELFGPSSSQSQGGLSRASSNSPGSSFFSLPPPTPPQTESDSFNPIAIDTTIDPSFFNFGIPQTSFNKPIDLSANNGSPSDSVTSPSSSAPYDFFGSLAGGGSGSGSSPDTAPSSAFSPKDFAIDPSLVGAPSPALPKQQHRSEPDEDSEDDEDDEEEQVVKPVKVGGKGKASRKGTVASGGVVKRTPGGNAVKDKNANDDDWRPTPEEYKKMSSKEKRQLRNKISARNFRVRRKEYITTLEGDIAERDRLIDAIREELGSTKLENVALRQEVDALKRAMLEGRADPVLPPPAPLTSTSSVTNTKRSTRTLAKPNTQKDLPTSPRVTAGRAFWGGSNTAFGAGGVTPVHATLVPDFPSFSESHQDQQENINPALNLPCFGGVGTATPNPKFPLSPFQQPNLGANFDVFTDLNPFTLKTLDAYRMQLWGRMAREAGAQQAQQQRQRAQSPTQSQGLSGALRPAFFTASQSVSNKERDTTKHASPTLTALLSGKTPCASSSTANSYPTPPSSPPSRVAEIQPQHAMLAGLASQTLLSKMGSAFWEAFARPSSASSPASSPSSRGTKADWDHDKVRRVLEGKAVVRVVDVDTPSVGASSADALEESMRALSIAGQADGSSACAAIFSRTRAAVVGKK